MIFKSLSNESCHSVGFVYGDQRFMENNFTLEAQSGSARAGVLKTRRGDVQTPFFMNVATRAAIKGGVSMEDLDDINTQVVLCNTYHLYLRPGEEIVKKAGGLHGFMKCEKPILTDSGGFQVFSIKSKKITDEGVWFRSHIDGKKFYLDAEKSIQIQHDLGADIIMAFDECPPNVPKFHKIRRAVERTTAWAKRSLAYHRKKFPEKMSLGEKPQLFGIVQGGCFPELRKKSLEEITELNFDGFALGGLAVGETSEEMYKVLDEMCPLMPESKPRYLMGVGTPENLLEAIERGVDMFDCVLPARNARHGTLYTWSGKMKIGNAQYRDDFEVIDPESSSPIVQKGFSRAYLHHLYRVDEALAKRYCTMHNLHFYNELLEKAREEIFSGNFSKWKDSLLTRWNNK